MIFFMLVLGFLVVACVQSKPVEPATTLTHEEMHEIMYSMLGDHFEEKHHDALHEQMESRGTLERETGHDSMHQFMTAWLEDHFEEKHHNELHTFMASKGMCGKEDCPIMDSENT